MIHHLIFSTIVHSNHTVLNLVDIMVNMAYSGLASCVCDPVFSYAEIALLEEASPIKL